MTDLFEEVKTSFEKSREVQDDGRGPLQLVSTQDELAPGFNAMRAYYEQRILVITRRGYRQYAGSTLPRESDKLIELTRKVMLAPMIAELLESFTDGVLIGHQDLFTVKLSTHFNTIEHVYHDEEFRSASRTMAIGFSQDSEVLEYFSRYVESGLDHLSHLTGFAHSTVDPNKVWDLWLLIGTAVASAAFLAGQLMGQGWAERDVLDGIEIATEEEPHGSE